MKKFGQLALWTTVPGALVIIDVNTILEELPSAINAHDCNESFCNFHFIPWYKIDLTGELLLIPTIV